MWVTVRSSSRSFIQRCRGGIAKADFPFHGQEPDMPDPNSPYDNPPNGTDELGLPVEGDPNDVVRAFLAMRDGQGRRHQHRSADQVRDGLISLSARAGTLRLPSVAAMQ